MLSSAVFADAKSDCIKALREARAAGLPLTAAELPKPKPSPDIVDMEAIAREVRPIFAKYGKRKFKIQQDWEKEFGSKRDVKVLTKRKKSDAELNECDKQLLVIANRLTVRQFTPRYASPAKMDEKFHSLSYLRSVLSNC